jgi:hypothetical protein
MFTRHPYIQRIQSVHSRQLALIPWYLEYVTRYGTQEWRWNHKNNLSSIINCNNRILPKFEISNVFPVIADNSNITYSIHASYIFHKRTKTHLTFLLTDFVPLSGERIIFVHLAAAPGRRLVSARSSNSTKLHSKYTYDTLLKKSVFTAGMITKCGQSYNVLLFTHIVFYSQ